MPKTPELLGAPPRDLPPAPPPGFRPEPHANLSYTRFARYSVRKYFTPPPPRRFEKRSAGPVSNT